MEGRKGGRQADFILTVITIILVLIGVIMVYDASYATSGSRYFLKQLVFAVVGMAVMFGTMSVPYWKLRGIAKIFLICSIIGLVLVLVPGIGHMVNGSRRWFLIGPIQIQPSEFAKFGLVLYMSAVLGEKLSKKKNMQNWQNTVVPIAVPVCAVGLLVVIEDMGTALVIIGAALALVFLAGARMEQIALISLVGVLGGVGMVLKESYRLDRLRAYVDPFKYDDGIGYQVCHSLIGLGSGGLLGKGFGEGREKLGFLPAKHTDFIFATFGQEFGWIFSSLLIALFLAFAVRALMIAHDTKEPFGRFLAAGIGIMIGGQALLNLAVVTNTLPNTGVPLPFISYGGSSLVLNLLCVGVLLGISRYPREIECYQHESSSNRRRDRRPRVSRTQYRRSAAR